MPSIVCYPGTFDPITKGHYALIDRAAKLFDKVVVGVAASTAKDTLFDTATRESMARAALEKFGNVVVKAFSGLTIDFARSENANIIIRGLRAVSDFDFEFQLSSMNKKIAPEIDTVFLPAATDDAYISSTMVREIASLGGDVSEFVDPLVLAELRQKFSG